MNDDDAARVLFRPSRKRKALRQRSDADNVSDNDDSAVSRAHKASRQRGGVAFTTSDDTAAAAAATVSTALIRADDAEDEIVAAAIGIPERFTRQTGLVTTVDDRHMYVASQRVLEEKQHNRPIHARLREPCPLPPKLSISYARVFSHRRPD